MQVWKKKQVKKIKMKNQPIQIVSSEDHTFILQNLDEVKRIFEADELRGHELVVVSIAGALRHGKSFLLNYFLRYLDARYKRHDVKDWIGRNKSDKTLNGFSWRGGKERKTIGIWMWSEVFIYDFKNGDKVAIILMDTQGIFDNKSSLKECISTFAISIMLSSVQCYNVSRQVQEDDLTNLQLFTEYAKYAMAGTDEKPFQKLLFIVRDWPSPYDHHFGPSKNYVVEDILAQNDEQTAEQHELRDEIKKSFDDIDAFLLPYPGNDVAQQSKDGSHKVQVLDKQFENCVEMLTEQLLAPEKLIRKKVGGVTIQAAAFSTYLEEYVKVFSGNEVPDPKTVLESTRDAQMSVFYKDCIVEYENGMKKEADSADVCFEDEELQQKHEATMEKAIALIENKKLICGPNRKALLINNLKDAIKKRYEKIKELNRLEREKIDSKKNWTLGGIAGGLGLVAAVASIVVTGPVGLVAYGIAAASATAGGGAGAGIGAALKWLAPRSWFGKKEALKEQVELSQEDEIKVNID